MTPLRVLLGVTLIAAAFGAGIGYDRWRDRQAAGTSAEAEAAAQRYFCPMHPDYQSDRPGTCPICGMNLVPMDTPAAPAAGAGPTTTAAGPPPPGSIRVSPDQQQLIGVTYGLVEETRDTRVIRAVGTIAIDETRVTKVHPRVDGWIERVFADETGTLVATGQPLVSIYSPDLLATQQEYLLALRTRDRQPGDATMQAQNDSLVAAARKRLELWDLGDRQIAEVESTGVPMTAVTIASPASGYLLTRNAYPRQRVTADTELYTIADLRRLWVQADVFEHDAAFIRTGQPARVTVSSTGRTIDATVALLAPQVDPATRTLKVRLDVPNRSLALRPDMFVDVEFALRQEARLTVPVGAVLDTGARKTAFVDRGDGFLEPRQVRTGTVVGDRIEILGGLSLGERVVTSGNFLIDSESQLRPAPVPPGSPAAGPPPAAPPAGHQHDGPTPPRGPGSGGQP